MGTVLLDAGLDEGQSSPRELESSGTRGHGAGQSSARDRARSSIDGSSRTRSMNMRKPRQLQDGACYHVTARANRKEMILSTSAVKELFLSVVKRAKNKYDFRLENFCIMGNHFHFVIRPGKRESLSAIMRWILSVFAMAYNKIRGLSGHVWGCRFFSRILANLREYTEVFEYIDNNPVKASQVEDRRQWRWGGLWHDRMGRREIIDGAASWLMPLFPEHRQLLLN
jgi:putative transposase